MIDIALHTIIGTLAAIGALSTALSMNDLRVARRRRRNGPSHIDIRTRRQP